MMVFARRASWCTVLLVLGCADEPAGGSSRDASPRDVGGVIDDAGASRTDAGVVLDAGGVDAGHDDAGEGDLDAGRSSDAGRVDTGVVDAGTTDAGPPDASTVDAGTPDAGTPDAGFPDAGFPDAGTPDAGTPDAGFPDAGTPDAGFVDAGTPDAGFPDSGVPPPVTCLEPGLVTQVIQDSASVGTPDTYFFDVNPGDPFCAEITGGGNGTWGVTVSNGTSIGIYCSNITPCRIRVPSGQLTLLVTAQTSAIGFYTLTVRSIPR